MTIKGSPLTRLVFEHRMRPYQNILSLFHQAQSTTIFRLLDNSNMNHNSAYNTLEHPYMLRAVNITIMSIYPLFSFASNQIY